MIQDLRDIFTLSISPGEMIVNIIIAFIAGGMIAIFYRYSYTGPGHSRSFINSLIILAMITSVVIMVIGNNLARAFGLVGAMSIIRFRTAVKDIQDIVFIFFTLAAGMASGVGLYRLALISVLLIGIVAFILSHTRKGISDSNEFLLQFIYEGKSAEKPEYLEILQKHCRKSQLINVRSEARSDQLEISYYIKLHKKSHTGKLMDALKSIDSIKSVNMFYDEERF